MDSEIQKRIERKGIVISRLPDWAKELFIKRAGEEFCDDYGMCLASMVKECGEYSQLKQIFFENKLNLKFLSDGAQSKNEDNLKEIKLGNGKIIKYNGGIKNGKDK